MRLQSVLNIAGTIGFAIPLIFTVAFGFTGALTLPLGEVGFYLWPASFGLMALDGAGWIGSISWVVVLAAINAAFYMIIAGGAFLAMQWLRSLVQPEHDLNSW